MDLAHAAVAGNRRPTPESSPAAAPSPRIALALVQLAEARTFAEDLRRDVWDFAVEMASLGLSTTGLRWLVCKGYVKHARETTRARGRRSFVATAPLAVTARSCFVISDAGLAAVAALNACGSREVLDGPSTDEPERGRLWPRWDPAFRELRLGINLIKRFRLPSPNQETILSAFEEEGWPGVIDDPLPPQSEQDAKRRLHDTIKSLNRHQIHPLIRFKGNGTGQGVFWEMVAPGDAQAAPCGADPRRTPAPDDPLSLSLYPRRRRNRAAR